MPLKTARGVCLEAQTPILPSCLSCCVALEDSLSSPHLIFRLRLQGGLLVNLGAHICSIEILSGLFLGGPGMDGRDPRSTKEGCYTRIVCRMDAQEKWS